MYCTDCGELIKTVKLPKTSHSIIIIPGEEETDDYLGLTDGEYCVKCNKMIVEPKVLCICIESDWIIDKSSTIEEDGSKHTECNKCDRWIKEEIIPMLSLEYKLVDNSYSVIGIGTYNQSDIVIPNTYNGLPVTSIGYEAFSHCDLITSVEIADSVTSIDYYAFSCCSSLTSIVIPDSVTNIDYRAFYGCNSLTIYCEAESQPTGWDNSWNPDNRPVVWGYKGE